MVSPPSTASSTTHTESVADRCMGICGYCGRPGAELHSAAVERQFHTRPVYVAKYFRVQRNPFLETSAAGTWAIKHVVDRTEQAGSTFKAYRRCEQCARLHVINELLRLYGVRRRFHEPVSLAARIRACAIFPLLGALLVFFAGLFDDRGPAIAVLPATVVFIVVLSLTLLVSRPWQWSRESKAIEEERLSTEKENALCDKACMLLSEREAEIRAAIRSAGFAAPTALKEAEIHVRHSPQVQSQDPLSARLESTLEAGATYEWEFEDSIVAEIRSATGLKSRTRTRPPWVRYSLEQKTKEAPAPSA